MLGKSQEVTRLLTTAGFPVLQHPKVFEISQVYRLAASIWAIAIATPAIRSPVTSSSCRRAGSVAVACRACATSSLSPSPAGPCTKNARGLGVNHAIPLSDHADYDELLEAVERTLPPKPSTARTAPRASLTACAPPATTPFRSTAKNASSPSRNCGCFEGRG